MMSYWTFDDVFEEGGVPKDSFHGGFGIIAVGGIKKPRFYDYALCTDWATSGWRIRPSNVLVTRKPDGALRSRRGTWSSLIRRAAATLSPGVSQCQPWCTEVLIRRVDENAQQHAWLRTDDGQSPVSDPGTDRATQPRERARSR